MNLTAKKLLFFCSVGFLVYCLSSKFLLVQYSNKWKVLYFVIIYQQISDLRTFGYFVLSQVYKFILETL